MREAELAALKRAFAALVSLMQREHQAGRLPDEDMKSVVGLFHVTLATYADALSVDGLPGSLFSIKAMRVLIANPDLAFRGIAATSASLLIVRRTVETTASFLQQKLPDRASEIKALLSQLDR